MRDKRPVDELSIEELERVLAIRKREARMQRFRRSEGAERVVPAPLPAAHEAMSQELAPVNDNNGALTPSPVAPQQHEASAIVPPPEPPLTYDLTAEAPQFEDELEPPVRLIEKAPKPPSPAKSLRPKKAAGEAEATPAWRKVVNRALLVVELAAVIGLAYLLYHAFRGLETIQDNTNQTQRELEEVAQRSRVTPTPRPELSPASLILPGGHTPPDEFGRGAFNYEEVYAAFTANQVPENVRPALLQQLTSATSVRPVDPLPQYPVALDIPAIGIRNASIYSGDDWETLKSGIGHMVGSGLPGSSQNIVLTGHNDIYGEIFRELEKLEPGDEVRVRAANQQVYVYRVRETRIVEPTEVWVLNPNLGAIVTLITCYPYRVDTQRLIVFAELVQ